LKAEGKDWIPGQARNDESDTGITEESANDGKATTHQIDGGQAQSIAARASEQEKNMLSGVMYFSKFGLFWWVSMN